MPGLPALEQGIIEALWATHSTQLAALALIQLGQPEGRWVLVLGRHRISAAGESDGGELGLVPVAHFQSLMDTVAMGPLGIISLRHTPSMRLLASKRFGPDAD